VSSELRVTSDAPANVGWQLNEAVIESVEVFSSRPNRGEPIQHTLFETFNGSLHGWRATPGWD
jgi:hypothetical protein